MLTSLTSVTFLVGLALIVVAALGGGVEVKEIKIANMKPVARLLCFAIGGALIAVSILRPDILLRVMNKATENARPAVQAEADRPPPSQKTEQKAEEKTAENLTIYFSHDLSSPVELASASVAIDGAEIGKLDVDTGHKFEVITFKTSKRFVSYLVKYEERRAKAPKPIQSYGAGKLELEDGARFGLNAVMKDGSLTVWFDRKS